MVADRNADSRRVSGRRGMALISAYMVLSLILIYSGGMTMRAGFQRVTTERLQDRTQALQLAQGALDQLKENLYTYLSSYVSAQVLQNDAGKTLTWDLERLSQPRVSRVASARPPDPRSDDEGVPSAARRGGATPETAACRRNPKGWAEMHRIASSLVVAVS